MRQRFWLFIHSEFECRPGMEDYIGDFDSFQKAEEVFKKESETAYENLIFRVFDSHSGVQFTENGRIENTKWTP